MNIILELTPEEYNLVHKGLTKLSIEEALPTFNKIIASVQKQFEALNSESNPETNKE